MAEWEGTANCCCCCCCRPPAGMAEVWSDSLTRCCVPAGMVLCTASAPCWWLPWRRVGCLPCILVVAVGALQWDAVLPPVPATGGEAEAMRSSVRPRLLKKTPSKACQGNNLPFTDIAHWDMAQVAIFPVQCCRPSGMAAQCGSVACCQSPAGMAGRCNSVPCCWSSAEMAE